MKDNAADDGSVVDHAERLELPPARAQLRKQGNYQIRDHFLAMVENPIDEKGLRPGSIRRDRLPAIAHAHAMPTAELLALVARILGGRGFKHGALSFDRP